MTPIARVDRIHATAYTIPTSTFGQRMPESDGTATWTSTGVLVVEVECDGRTGLGYAYTSPAALTVVRDVLAPVVLDADPRETTARSELRMGVLVEPVTRPCTVPSWIWAHFRSPSQAVK
jgi:L-alanine-DL-glutamate epimerase-like enolase superfamily enzyme